MKKLVKLYEDLLNEGGTDILYHFTYSTKLINILNLNKFFLTGSISTKAEETKGKLYFMSFSRSKSTEHGYGTKFKNPKSVRIKVNGQKLGHNHKIMPIDYWQYPRTPEFMNQKIGDEMEDRVVSDNDEIPNANKYIISIDIFVDKEGVQSELITKAKELGIQLYFFNNEKDFANGNPNRSIKPNISTEKQSTSNFGRYFDITLGTLTYKNDELKTKTLNGLKQNFNLSDEQIELYNKNIQKHHEKLNYYLQDDDYYLTDLTNSLSSELHNNKSSTDPMARYVNKIFNYDYKQSKSTSLKDYLLNLFYKGKKRQKDYNIEFNDKIQETIKKAYSDNFSKYNYNTYDVDGNPVDDHLLYPPLKKYVDKKIKELQNNISEFILNDNEMYKNSWKLNTSELRGNLNLDDDEIRQALSGLTNVDPDDIKGFINSILWEVDEIAYSEVSRIKNEMGF